MLVEILKVVEHGLYGVDLYIKVRRAENLLNGFVVDDGDNNGNCWEVPGFVPVPADLGIILESLFHFDDNVDVGVFFLALRLIKKGEIRIMLLHLGRRRKAWRRARSSRRLRCRRNTVWSRRCMGATPTSWFPSRLLLKRLNLSLTFEYFKGLDWLGLYMRLGSSVLLQDSLI